MKTIELETIINITVECKHCGDPIDITELHQLHGMIGGNMLVNIIVDIPSCNENLEEILETKK